MADDREVVVTDIQIPFWSMVVLMVKWAIAVIPALILLMVICAVFLMASDAIFDGGFHHWGIGRWGMR